LLNASVGMQRVRERLQPTVHSRPATTAGLERLTVAALRLRNRTISLAGHAIALRPQLPRLPEPATRRIRHTATPAVGLGPRSLGARPRMSLRHRPAAAHRIVRREPVATLLVKRLRHAVRSDGVLPVAVAVIVLFASIASGVPANALGGGSNAPVGGPTGSGTEPRIALGGLGGGFAEGDVGANGSNQSDTGNESSAVASDEEVARLLRGLGPEARALQEEPVDEVGLTPLIDGPFLEDGTLLKPIAVDTSVADGSGLVRQYRVRSGDTLVGIAARFDVQMMTVWWANRLSSKNDLRVGQVLRIPTVDGLVVTVKAGDTLRSVARANHVKQLAIYEVNGLTDPNLVVGQTLLIPGARGEAIKVPKATPRTDSRPGQTRTTRPPSRYTGGAFAWPVSGGYISQYFHYGHYALDIAADYGTSIRSGASGTVIFAGWRDNCGGYQVWIAHGSGLYTTYSHMSSVTVGRGQSVSRGQQVGRIGTSGCVTGPHLHFEVWRGYPWQGGSNRVNPLNYY
jgi:murein DD-endopeptidase MepM/ murein hydrolase activator NlpD